MRETLHTTFDAQLAEILQGKRIPPGIQKEPASEDILWRMSSAYRVESVYEIPLSRYNEKAGTYDQRLFHAKLFVECGGMDGSFKGSGIILSAGKLYSFSMCEHTYDRTGENPSRGWHPAVCKKCGFDASIDSGD